MWARRITSTASHNDSEVSDNDRNTNPSDDRNTDPEMIVIQILQMIAILIRASNQLTPLSESRILTTTSEQQLVVVNPISGEVQPLAYTGRVSHLSLAPVTAGNRIGIILADGRETETDDAENNFTNTTTETSYRFLY